MRFGRLTKRAYLCTMKRKTNRRKLSIVGLSLLITTTITAQNNSLATDTMNSKTMNTFEKALVTLAANEAVGNLDALYESINAALDNGLTVNQLKEAFAHLYAYTGFPRSLNAQGVLQQVLHDRDAKGKVVVVGRSATPLPADYDALEQGTKVQTTLCGRAFSYDFCPVEDYFLKAHLFGDIFARDVLTPQEREILTVAALSAMEGTKPQLQSHQAIAIRAGVSQEVVAEIVALAHEIGSRKRLTFAIGEPNTQYAAYFQGQSHLASLVDGEQPVNNVTFEPACRNNWHIHHDARQILICVAGEGWYQEWGKTAQHLQVGDVVDIPVGVKHWHGATRDSWFQHIVFHIAATPQTGDTKTGNEWLEPVTDEQYNIL